jgi:glyoxylase-like metal-dependent hydrolase (beta-lactamase superfamily II)
MTKIFSIEGNTQKLDGGAMFGNCPKALWERWLKPDEKGRVGLACRSMLIVDEDDRVILCEAGIGAFFEPKMADRFGVENSDRHILRESLAKVGFSPDDVDVVVLSHLHFDHAGGILPSYDEIQKEGMHLLFKNASYVLGEEALARAKSPHMRDKASFIPGLTKLLENTKNLEIITGQTSKVLGEKFEFITTSGHTPGQIHVLYKGSDEPIFFCGDLIPGTPWVHLPITMGYDRFPEKLIDEKSEILNRAVEENWSLFYTHDVHFACSKISMDEKGRFKPDNAVKVLDVTF